MQPEFYQNMKKMVVFMEVLLSPSINKNKLLLIETVIVDFVKEVELLYFENAMLSGVHELLHLVDCTIDFVLLNHINCF